jgi:uncharacterized protein YhaN
MHLRRIEIRDFRKLSHVIVDDLKDGLNVLVGDNEAGKSTILAAIRAALFERHRVGGDVAAAMQPYGQSVRPQVAIDFELDGKPWTLRKAFCQRQEVELIGPSERYTNDPAEEKLAELFGFTPPGRGGSKPDEHQGIYGLLWVEQGKSHKELGIGAGRESLASALESEVGQVLGGERGRALLASAETRRHTFWDKRNNPKGAYKDLIDQVERLTAQKRELENALVTYDDKIAILAKKQDILARYKREEALEKTTASVATAEQAVAHAKKLETVLGEVLERQKRLKGEHEAAAERLQVREKLKRQVGEAKSLLERVSGEAAEARAALARYETLERAANEELVRARDARLAADKHVSAIEHAIGRRRFEQELARLEGQLTNADNAEAKRREALAAAGAISIDQKQVAEIEKRVGELERLQARLDAASVKIAFEATGSQRITVDGNSYNAQSALLLSNDATLELEGFGRLSIHPGGGISEIAQAVQDATHALNRSLQKAGVTSAADARAELQRKADALAEADLQKKLVAASAPNGLEALRQEVEGHRAHVRRYSANAPEAASEASEEDLELARHAQKLAAQVEASCEADSQRAGAAREAASLDVATKIERAAAAGRDHDAKVAELASAREKTSDDTLRDSCDAAHNTLSGITDEELAARAALERADPEAATLELRRARSAEEAIRHDIEKTSREVRDLEIELKALGQNGLGEQLAEVEGELVLKQGHVRSKRIEAEAARLLHETLAQAQRESKDRWLGPVRERVAPYMRLIQPDSDIVLNEKTLEIEKIVRAGKTEPFTGLSMGAREQAAVITRLALADILRGSGLPSAVILDDALVNTDEARLERMHLVLHKAAQTLQILVLTCRERDFLQLGAPIRRI